MRAISASLLVVVLLLSSCGPLTRLVDRLNPPPREPVTVVEESGALRIGEIHIRPDRTEAAVEWGTTAMIVFDLTADSTNRKYAVQMLPAATTPLWLSVEMQPSILEPPGQIKALITPALGEAHLGPQTLTFEVSGYGIREPVKIEIELTVQRQSGDMVEWAPGVQAIECRGICGQVKDGVVTFYDVLREKKQSCGTASLPDSQRIGGRSFALGRKGFGYGRTCRVAAIHESAGGLTFLNLGLSKQAPRGAVLFRIPAGDNVWFSPDNTVAVVQEGSLLVPYDVVAGRPLAEGCRYRGDLGPMRLSGIDLTAGSCSWQIR